MNVSKTRPVIQFLPHPAFLFPALLTYQQTLPLARSHFLDSDRFFSSTAGLPGTRFYSTQRQRLLFCWNQRFKFTFTQHILLHALLNKFFHLLYQLPCTYAVFSAPFYISHHPGSFPFFLHTKF